MAAPKGNTYYKMVKNWKHGNERKYTPESLWKKALEYFEWAEKNPLKEEKAFRTGIVLHVNKKRAISIAGFCVFANMTTRTFNKYDNEEAYIPVTTRIKEFMFADKFEGAAANLLNANIIARDLSLIDKKEVDNKFNGKPLTKDLAKQIIDELG